MQGPGPAERTAPPAERKAADGLPSAPSGALPPGLSLRELDDKVRQCTACPLHEQRTHTAFDRGNPEAELMFVGEGPGYEEDLQGIAFVGPAGQLLDRMIAAMGFGHDEVYICNVVKCRPPKNRKPTAAEMACCVPYLHRQIELVGPAVIVTLGATGLQGLLGLDDGVGITRLRGRWRLYQGRIPVMPTFHPAYLLRSPDKKRQVWQDLQQVMQRLGKPLPARQVSPRRGD